MSNTTYASSPRARVARATPDRRLSNLLLGSVALGATLLCAAAVPAQQVSPAALTGKFTGTFFLQVTEPKGDFGRNTGNGWGLGGSGVWQLDDSGIAHIRTDLGFVTYGSNTRRIDFANTGGLVKLDLETTSSIFSMVVGPQLGGTVGPVAPYAAAVGGFSVFWTSSSVKGSNNDEDDDFASTTNSSDAVWSYGGVAGATIRVGNSSSREIRLDLGARYLRHDDVRYLNSQRIQDAFDNNRDPVPIRGRADFVSYYLGINAVVF